MIQKFNLSGISLNLLFPETSYARKTGLLNHVKLNCDEGIVYRNKKIFHTFGMNFPIAVACLNKDKKLLSSAKCVDKDCLFLVPNKSHYILEIHTDHVEFLQHTDHGNEIKIVSGKKAKFIYLFFKNIFLILFSLLFLLLTYTAVYADEKINLNLGRSRVLDLGKPPQSIQISDPEILEIQRIGISNSIRIIPKQNGDSSVAVLYSGGEEVIWNIHIGKSNASESSSSDNSDSSYLQGDESSVALDVVAKPMVNLPGIHISQKSGKVLILGKVSRLEDFRKIAKSVGAHPTVFFPAFVIPESLENSVLNSVNSDLRTLSERNLTVAIRGGLFAVTGVPSSPAGKIRAWNYLSGLIPNIIDATSYSSGESSIVQVNLDFLEVGKTNGKNFGFHMPGMSDVSGGLNFPAGGLSQGIVEPMLQIAPVSLFFKALEENNFAREIAKPVVITRSGEKASFLAGGEVPIVSTVSNNASSSSSVVYKPFGILFNVTPQTQIDGSIWLKLDLEVSQVSEQLSYQNIPGFTTRRVNTNIILKEGSTAVLSGLVHDKDFKLVEKFPLFGSLPILGELFKSRRFQKQDTELWIAVTALRWNSEDQDINSYQNKILEKKFNSAKKYTQPSLLD